MLGKGLESLIPPSTGSGQAPQRGSRPGEARSGGAAGQAPQDSQSQSDGGQLWSKSGDANFNSDPPPKIIHENEASPISQLASSSTQLGIGASFPVAPAPVFEKIREKKSLTKATEDYIFHIEVEKIKPNPNQPRKDFNEAGIRELASSIREFGFLQPMVVSKIEHETQGGVEVEYQLIAGERRLHAAKMLGLLVVPAIVRNVNLEREKLEMAVIENIQREGLNPIETARAFARLQDEFRLTQREIAAKLGKSREVVANTVRLLSLPIYIQESLEKGHLSESHGRLLLSIEDLGAQKKLFEDILAHGMTTRELKTRVQMSKPRKTMPKEALSPEIKMMEEKLSMDLGTPVKIEKGAGTGKIVIAFYSEEELENIVQKIGKEGT
ncbi:MAG: ParB/RepB/Spo0J family partition protein [bacterium]|nr:ParB/RepB/Spo0J family partition protein [bacterium]